MAKWHSSINRTTFLTQTNLLCKFAVLIELHLLCKLQILQIFSSFSFSAFPLLHKKDSSTNIFILFRHRFSLLHKKRFALSKCFPAFFRLLQKIFSVPFLFLLLQGKDHNINTYLVYFQHALLAFLGERWIWKICSSALPLLICRLGIRARIRWRRKSYERFESLRGGIWGRGLFKSGVGGSYLLCRVF